MILDAISPPDVDAANTYKLAYWLMNTLKGEKLSIIGVKPILHDHDKMVATLPLKKEIF
jgi:hypothetical protein